MYRLKFPSFKLSLLVALKGNVPQPIKTSTLIPHRPSSPTLPHVQLHLPGYQELVGQQLELPDPDAAGELEDELLGEDTEPLRAPALDRGTVVLQGRTAVVIVTPCSVHYLELYLLSHQPVR